MLCIFWTETSNQKFSLSDCLSPRKFRLGLAETLSSLQQDADAKLSLNFSVVDFITRVWLKLQPHSKEDVVGPIVKFAFAIEQRTLGKAGIKSQRIGRKVTVLDK